MNYQKLTQKEHILKRPGMYIGSTESSEVTVYNFINNEMVQDISKVPMGVMKLVNEAIDNAKDNIPRSIDLGKKQSYIKINVENKKLTVSNDGHCVPVKTNEQGEMIPEFVFGTLLTGSNYDDTVTRTSIGTNGLGIKLAVIFSKYFSVRIHDPENKKEYFQEFIDSEPKEPEIKKYNKKTSMVEVTFELNESYFGDYSSEDFFTRINTIAVSTAMLVNPVKVYFNGELLKVKSRLEYFQMYDPDIIGVNLDTPLGPWFIGAGIKKSSESISFVNGSETIRGGKHVNYFVSRIVKILCEILKKKTKKTITESFVKGFLTVYIIAVVRNPTFDSQAKECMTLESKNWGTLELILPDSFKKKLQGSMIITEILNSLIVKESKTIEKLTKSINIPKLTDANKAGIEPAKCTLFITEGDSANGMATTGIAVVGHNYYGSFPIRGKILNVRDSSDFLKNEEIKNIIQILNLQMNKVYTKINGEFVCDTGKLRYSTLAIMSDQDTDGSHIKGLLLNFISYFWPSLIENQFVKVFITPIIKVFNVNGKDLLFFNQVDYNNQKESLKKYKVKYYKGLGTSNKQETIEYFENINKFIIEFHKGSQKDLDSLDNVFRKSKSDIRKQWILNTIPQNVDYTKTQTISEFIDNELLLFSLDNLNRSIPSITDGLKPSQRKILYSAFKKGLRTSANEIKVSQFSGYISQITEYHHGEVSLEKAIVGMAQSFVGSNNIPYFIEDGNFGSRNKGGEDSAASRYIYTYLNPVIDKIFINTDNNILDYIVEENIQIEPEYYAPIIPMVLVNGTVGIGTGWSTRIPCYNPIEIRDYLISKINGGQCKIPSVYYNGFTGEIIEKETVVITRGIIKLNKNVFDITELPIGVWTEDYKIFLNKLRETGLIKGYTEHHKINTVHFKVNMTAMQLKNVKDAYDFFKLESKIPLTNLTLFTPDKKIKVYENVKEILDNWFDWRITLFTKRKEYILNNNEKEIKSLNEKIRFIKLVVKSPEILMNKPLKTIKKTLEINRFHEIDKLLEIKSYNYTKEYIEDLVKKSQNLQKEIDELKGTTEKELFKADLMNLEIIH